MTDTSQLPPLPTLQPGDSHMESLIEAAIQGHAGTRDAMRWLVRQLVPATQPAEVTDAEQQAIDQIMEQAQVFASAWSLVGGSFDSGYALDDALDAKEELREIVARAILALRPVQVPMTPTERERELDRSPVDASWEAGDAFMEGIYAAEAHHGITAQAKKETP